MICCGCRSLNLFPVSEDQKLGLQVSKEIEGNTKDYPILDNPRATRYLQDIVNVLIQSPQVQYRGVFPYKVKIINSDKVVNAFCTPGGYIYVYTGLIKMIDNEATLAGILAHEIAHAELRHSTKRMSQAFGAQLLLELALGNNTPKSVEVAANLFTGLALLKNSRDDETESDNYSFLYLQSTNKWYPGAIKLFFEKMGSRAGDNALTGILSTHPLDKDRVENINRLLKEHDVPPPKEENLGRRVYQEFKKLFTDNQ
jgi:predicted Zn-dependent protease